MIGAECRYRYQQYAGVVGAGLRCGGCRLRCDGGRVQVW